MNFLEYQQKALATKVYSTNHSIVYPSLGLLSEAGEVAGKVKKVLRDKEGIFGHEERHGISREIGDVLWYCSALASDLGITLEQIAQENLQKLEDRLESNTLAGSGDDR